MLDVTVLPVFALAVLALAVTPGQDLALILARGVGQGRKIAFCTVVGFALAGAIQIPAVAFGLASFLQSYPFAFDAIKYAGAIYLIYIGISTFRGARAHELTATIQPIPAVQAIREGFIASLLNPKAILFIFAFLPQFVDNSLSNISVQLLFLGIIMKVIVFGVESSLAFASGYARDWLSADARRQRNLQYIAAFVLCFLGVSVFIT
jgi:threonine/homoserine/homoserine lactone efflux protein